MNVDGVRVAQRCEQFSRELSGEAMKKRLKAAGERAAKEVNAAVRSTPVAHGSLADLRLSGSGDRDKPSPGRWAQIDLTARARVDGSSFIVTPTSKAYGPLAMLERGRAARRAGQLRSRGTRTSKKTGAVSTRLARVSRNAGATEAKGTWSKAAEAMARTSGRLYAVEVSKSFRSTFRG